MTDLWRRKLKTCFKKFDFDGDGLWTIQDYVGFAENIIKNGNLNSSKAEALRKAEIEVYLYISYF